MSWLLIVDPKLFILIIVVLYLLSELADGFYILKWLAKLFVRLGRKIAGRKPETTADPSLPPPFK